jgi:uncharacterized protein
LRPTASEGITLLRNEGASERLVEHCKTVSKVSEIIAKGIKSNGYNVDVGLVKIGGLLHDIGRTKVNTVFHGYIGGDILRNKGFEEKVARFCETHIGGGISPEEAKKLNLPDRDYIPRTLEEKIVSFSDKISGVEEIIPLRETISQFKRRGIGTEPIEKLDLEIRNYLEFDGYDYVRMKFFKAKGKI